MNEQHPLICVMGVSACGKSTVGERLARHLGVPFLDGDSLHPAENTARMTAGVPLTDDDRWPWLDAIGRRFADAADSGLVVACSALRRAYRDRLRAAAPGIRFVHLDGPDALLAERAAARSHEFMPASLLASQLATLERLGADEDGIVVSIDASPDDIVAEAIDRL